MIFDVTLFRAVMNLKSKRLGAIRQIIMTQKIGSQDELLTYLESAGFATTQATLSRDLKFLKVSKAFDSSNSYIYVLPDMASTTRPKEDLVADDFQMRKIDTIDFSGNMAVIRTQPGFANSIASVIDSQNLREVLGTIAGDDTIILVIRENVSRAELLAALTVCLPDIKRKVFN